MYTNILSHLEILENPTFLILTDRRDLDEQLGNFFQVAGFPYPRPKTAILEAESILNLEKNYRFQRARLSLQRFKNFR